MVGAFRRTFWLCYMIAFIVLMPATVYEVLRRQLPKAVLFGIPVYAFLAWGSYVNFKRRRRT